MRFRDRGYRGFALVITLSLMILLALLAVGLLSLSAVELRRSAIGDARAAAMANARLGIMMALGQLQREAGDDRRVTANAGILKADENPMAVGVWDGWSPGLAVRNRPGVLRVDYDKPKSQEGFRTWLASAADPLEAKKIDWGKAPVSDPGGLLFDEESCGFNLGGERLSLVTGGKQGGVAWAVTQENTKAKINIPADDRKRIDPSDQRQAPTRPNLSLASYLKHPEDDAWARRSGTILTMGQSALDEGYRARRESVGKAAKDFTVNSYSLLTDVVNGGTKVDLTSGFDLNDGEFALDKWGNFANPFRATSPSSYRGQKPLFAPLIASADASVVMDFHPATVNHSFTVNGAPTFDTLRAHYRTYRHLYNSSGTTAFERPYSHIAGKRVDNIRPFGRKTHPALMPVLDRVYMIYSIYAKADGTLGILITPFVTVWNPHNVALETEGMVVYPWIDLAVFWGWNVSIGGQTITKRPSLSRFVGEGFRDNGGTPHGRSSRPYFYLHLTQSGRAAARAKNIDPAIRLMPGEVRVFCLAETARRDLEVQAGAAVRSWRMKPVGSASDITNSLKNGIVLNMAKGLNPNEGFTQKMQAGRGDRVNASTVEFDRSQYYYIMNMADSWGIKNPDTELMVETRPAQAGLASLPATPNLYYYAQVHSHRATSKGNDSFSYPGYSFEELNENPKMIGAMLTYHRVAYHNTGLPLADLMYTVNPRQAWINQYLSGINQGAAQFQSAPHYESLMKGGTSLVQLALETTTDGQKAFYGPSHSARNGRSNLCFFEVPRSPTLSLGTFQHCDLATTPYGVASQIANSWASAYLDSRSVSRTATSAPSGEQINPGLAIYDYSYLANEVLFDGYFLSGAAPRFGSRSSPTGSPAVWDEDQISEAVRTVDVLESFFTDPVANPLRNPRMSPYLAGSTPYEIKGVLDTPARCMLIAGYLMFEGGFNINSTSEEAWAAVLASLRGVSPASSNRTSQSRFRHLLTSAPYDMKENDPWSGFRTLTDTEIRELATKIVEEIKKRGPFLSVGEFVNRRIATGATGLSGALQAAIDATSLNRNFTYNTFDTTAYPFRNNIPRPPNTGINTPGWLSQADVLHALAPVITARSDTFVIRSLGEARDASGRVTASVRLEAVVQRVPEWVDPADQKHARVTELQSALNKRFGRRFEVVAVREIKGTTI